MKKDHAAVASVIARAGSYASGSGQRMVIRNIAMALALEFAASYSRFDHAAFYRACNVTDAEGNVILASDELIR